MPTEMLTRSNRAVAERATRPTSRDELRPPAPEDAKRLRRLKLGAVAWGVWTVLLTTLWVTHEWEANGALQRFGHEGDPGQWNPTLWALGVGLPTLVVGIMGLGVYFVRPTADPAVLRLERLKFHVGAWLFGMVVLTPLWALIEWQDNGGFERWSAASRPGDWDPWIVVAGGVWALSILGLFVVRRILERPADAG